MTRQDVVKRRVGFVFQHYALFRHMTVFDNVGFGLTVRPRRSRPKKPEIRERVMKLLQLVQLDSMADRFPHQLSGGQRQRVALARALAVEPRVLLLDEPFGALDAKVRKELRRWLRKLHDEVHITSVFVTHDQEEALEVADRIAVMNRGRIEQIGTPEEVYESPASPFVYEFLGNVNLFHGRMDDGRLHLGDKANGAPVAFVRPHDVEIRRTAAEAGNGESIPARIDHISTAGPFVQVYLVRKDTSEPIEASLTRERYRELELRAQDDVFIMVKNARVFAEDYSI